MIKSYLIVILAYSFTPKASAGCQEIRLNGCMNYKACGIYYVWDNGDPCGGVVVYKHLDSSRMIYFIDGFWIVHDEACSTLGVGASDLRVEDGAMYVDEITGRWQESNNGYWIYNNNIGVDCVHGYIPADGSDGEPTTAPGEGGSLSLLVIVVIAAGVFFTLCISVLIIVLHRKKKRTRQNKKENKIPPSDLKPYLVDEPRNAIPVKTIHDFSSTKEISFSDDERQLYNYNYPISSI